MLTGKYKCKLCGAIIEDVPDALDKHLIEHNVDIYDMCKSGKWDSESIYDEYYKRNV